MVMLWWVITSIFSQRGCCDVTFIHDHQDNFVRPKCSLIPETIAHVELIILESEHTKYCDLKITDFTNLQFMSYIYIFVDRPVTSSLYSNVSCFLLNLIKPQMDWKLFDLYVTTESVSAFNKSTQIMRLVRNGSKIKRKFVCK